MNAAACAMEERQPAQEHELWARWRIHGDEQARNTLVLQYSAWARKLARDIFMRVRGHGADWPDYVQNASVGMLEAMSSFDPHRGVPFEAYARQRVRGAVFNGLRALLAASSMKAGGDAFERGASLLEDSEADPVERLVSIVSGLGIGYMLSSQPEHDVHAVSPTPYDEAVRSQLRERLAALLALLPERERLVLQLHYLQHMAFVEIAEALALTKGRISQLHRQGLERLRSRMLDERWQVAL